MFIKFERSENHKKLFCNFLGHKKILLGFFSCFTKLEKISLLPIINEIFLFIAGTKLFIEPIFKLEMENLEINDYDSYWQNKLS